MSPDEARARCAAALDRQAQITGDARYQQAAAALRKKPRGRPGVDDSAQLLRVQVLLDMGEAKDAGAAARQVATDMPGCDEQFRTRWQRLLNKHKAGLFR